MTLKTLLWACCWGLAFWAALIIGSLEAGHFHVLP